MSQPISRDQHVNAFLAALQEKQGREWDGTWEDWTAIQRASCIRAIMADTLAEHGAGSDWGQASRQSAFVMSSIFHERYPLASSSEPAPYLDLQVAFREEAYAVKLRRPALSLLPPVPVPGGAAKAAPAAGTVFGESMARAGVFSPVEDIPPGVYSDALEQIGEVIASKDRAALMMLGALCVLWKTAQVFGTQRGGVLFREIHDPSDPSSVRGDVVLAYERQTPDSLSGQQSSPDGGSYFLIPG